MCRQMKLAGYERSVYQFETSWMEKAGTEAVKAVCYSTLVNLIRECISFI
jgi:hypothetical protein